MAEGSEQIRPVSFLVLTTTIASGSVHDSSSEATYQHDREDCVSPDEHPEQKKQGLADFCVLEGILSKIIHRSCRKNASTPKKA